MSKQPMDFRDYLIRQQQQSWQQDQIDKLFAKDQDRDAEIHHRVEQQARDAAQSDAVVASDAEEALTDVVTQARDLRKRITSGVVSPGDARRLLAERRQRQREIVAQAPSIKIAYDGAARTIEDPAARVAELTSKFGSLRQ
jgi:hypothetical protein